MLKVPLARTVCRLLGSSVVLSAVLVATASQASAAEGSIDHVQTKDGSLQILFSLQGDVSPNLDSIAVTLGNTPLTAVAEKASAAQEQIRRTAILAVDVSNSMQGAKFDAAKASADVFLENAPDDLYIGLVTFAGSVATIAAPTTDHASLKETIASLELSQGTELYSGVKEAVQLAGTQGARSVLVLSDGADSTDTPIDTALNAINLSSVDESKVKVDVVAIAQNADNRAKLTQLSDAGGGTVLDAGDPSKLRALFAEEAQQLAQQVLVTATPPETLLGTDGEVLVSIVAGADTYTDSAFLTMPALASAPTTPDELAAADSSFQIPRSLMFVGLGGAAVGLAILLITATSGAMTPEQDAVDRSIEAYTRQGARRIAAAKAGESQVSMTQQAVGAAARVLESNKGLEASLGNRLEAAGMQIKPAEWLLIHAGITVAAGLVALLLGGGSIIFMLVGLLLGVVLPWLYLGFKRKRRVRAFKGQLPDTLQLMAGSLSAGLSLAQSADTVVREGTEPMSNEFRRALVETRLGVEIDDALGGIADRMGSKDFEWIVMAIRIQREVGGNLSELLHKVSETIREREYLERQVSSLSAEGRLSVWILGGLPPGFILYLTVANPAYLSPLIHQTLGWVMLFVMSVLLVTGIFWMKRLVKVDV